MINFKYHSTDNGNCRAYYTSPQRKGSLYCLQAVSDGHYEMLICSRDGEPEAPVMWQYIGNIEDPKGDDSTDRGIRKFLTKPNLGARMAEDYEARQQNALAALQELAEENEWE